MRQPLAKRYTFDPVNLATIEQASEQVHKAK
jgi:hypothetical protein